MHSIAPADSCYSKKSTPCRADSKAEPVVDEDLPSNGDRGHISTSRLAVSDRFEDPIEPSKPIRSENYPVVRCGMTQDPGQGSSDLKVVRELVDII